MLALVFGGRRRRQKREAKPEAIVSPKTERVISPEELARLNREIRTAEIRLDWTQKRIDQLASEHEELTARHNQLRHDEVKRGQAAGARIERDRAQAQERIDQHRDATEREIQQFEAVAGELVAQRYAAGDLLGRLLDEAWQMRIKSTATTLESKDRPAVVAAQQVREIGARLTESKRVAARAAGLLAYYEALFPWLVEVRPLDPAEGEATPTSDDADDPARHYLSAEEWAQRTSAERSQLALDRWLRGRRTDWQLGTDYERYVGWLREKDGASVVYHGIIEGFDDLGRDLIVTRPDGVEIVQCKRWARFKTIYENHLFQLAGTVLAARLERPHDSVRGTFVTTTQLSERARAFAQALSITVVEGFPMGDYPRIKCNVASSGERIYHLPFDQQYDRTVIRNEGECFVATAAEAESLGFRRAKRWQPPVTATASPS
jgi:hypothetical protein